MRNRPQLVTTIDPDMNELLRQVAEKDERPLSFVLDKALHVWAITLADADKITEVPA
jgi:hypothetical protein